MLGKAKKSSLLDVGNVFELGPPDDSFYAQLGRAEGLIRDEDFQFRRWCKRCPLRHKCVQAQQLQPGRTVQVHPQEKLLQTTRECHTTEEGQQTLRCRVGVEHAFAWLARPALGQARYFGRPKSRFQVVMTFAAANLRLLLRWDAA